MKKVGVLFVLLLFSVSFVIASDMPSAPGGIGGDDMGDIQGAVDQIPIDPNTGGLDQDKIDEQKSKAEERIDAINLWLDDNAYWLKWVFGIVPEVSWLFAINFLLILTFFNGLFMNAEHTLVVFPKNIARIIGGAIFAFLLITKFILNVIAIPTTAVITSWWGQLIIIILLVVINPLMAFYFKYVSNKKESVKKEQTERDRLVVHGEASAIRNARK